MSAEIWKKVKHFVGVPLDEEEMMDSYSSTSVSTVTAPSESSEDRQVRQRRRTTEKSANIVGLNTSMSQSEMVIVEPKSFDDALDIVESLRRRKAIIINLNGLEQEQAQRLIDFVAGATHALDGNQERVGEGIFLFSPSNVVINALGTEQPWLNRDARDLFWRVK